MRILAAGTTKITKNQFSLCYTVVLACLLTAVIIPGVNGANPLELGTAGTFVILAESGIGNTPTSQVTGDIGLSPITGATITGLTCPEVTGTIYTVDDTGPACRVVDPTLLTAAITDMHTAYLNGENLTSADYTDIGNSGDIGGLTLTPGLYTFSSAVRMTGDVTLSGSGTSGGVWIFQVPGTSALNIDAGRKIILIDGAETKNIFWVVGGATTLGANSVFNGNILDKTAIVFGSGAKLNGKALAQTTVTLYGSTVAQPPVAGFTVTPPGGPAYLNVVFNDTSTSTVTNTDWAWTFGDGASSAEQNPSHTYMVPGTYTVMLMVTNANGGTDSITKTVTVTQPSLEITLTNVPVSLSLGPEATTTNSDGGFYVNSTTDWQVTAKDMDTITSGYMTSYSVSGLQYQDPGTKLNQPFKVMDFQGSYVPLPSGSGTAVVIKTGTPEISGTAYPLGVRQEVKVTDPVLSGTDEYRIVVTLTVGSL